MSFLGAQRRLLFQSTNMVIVNALLYKGGMNCSLAAFDRGKKSRFSSQLITDKDMYYCFTPFQAILAK